MAANKQTTTALLAEHFRYTPLTLLDDIINTVNELVFRAVNGIEEGLAKIEADQLGFRLNKEDLAKTSNVDEMRDALTELKQNELDNGIVRLESLLNATVDKDFDKFEIYTLRNILAVGHEEDDLANWVRLDHYKGIDVVDIDDVPTPEAVQLQRCKLHETAKLNTMLKAEEAKNAAILSQLTSLIGAETEEEREDRSAPLAFLRSSRQNAGAQQLTEGTQAVVTQIPALQQLLEKLKEAMQTLPDTRQTKHEDEDSAEIRRRRYLETQSRRALERNGVDPNASTGASLAVGRKVGRDELEGIESVAQTLGGAEKRT